MYELTLLTYVYLGTYPNVLSWVIVQANANNTKLSSQDKLVGMLLDKKDVIFVKYL